MKRISIVTTMFILFGLVAAPAFSQSRNPQVACLGGTWTPDLEKMKAAIGAQIDTPNVEYSGSLSMVINEINVPDGVEFHADGWTLLRLYDDKPDSGFTVTGVAMLNMSAPPGGSFYFSEISNTYLQKLITPGPEGPINDPIIDPVRGMLLMGEWARGSWTCKDDVIHFTVSDQDPDGQLIETWYRQE